MNNKISIAWLSAMFLLLLACGGSGAGGQKPAEQRAFYYWKTRLSLDKASAKLADDLRVGRFYLRLFDVEYSPLYGEAVPVGSLDANSFYSGYATTKPFTPVVFISNNAFSHLDAQGCTVLAEKIVRKVAEYKGQLAEAMSNNLPYDDAQPYEENQRLRDSLKAVYLEAVGELQIDCDWTASTRERYFQFLKEVKQRLPKGQGLSCTLRLHQYKYREETGVPPVDRAMLMCYNMDDIKNPDTENSIFSAAVAKKYLAEKGYPLPLDVALPIFSWGILFREGVFKGILNNLDENLVRADSQLEKIGGNRYRFKVDAEIGNTYIREGDVLRLEQPDKQEIEEVIKLLNSKIDTRQSTVAFYHWDEQLIKNYQNEINTYYNSFN
jgi:hypothetical protein